MNLVRLGHYFVPSVTSGDLEAGQDLAGSCRTALVVAGLPGADETMAQTVALAVWSHTGVQSAHTSVPVEEPGVGHDSFHLSGNCPWFR